jgi:hypothetical protein
MHDDESRYHEEHDHRVAGERRDQPEQPARNTRQREMVEEDRERREHAHGIDIERSLARERQRRRAKRGHAPRLSILNS